jgi:hypothetical protein
MDATARRMAEPCVDALAACAGGISIDSDRMISPSAPMSASIANFIRELIRAANEVEQLTGFECARLLRRSAATIWDYREQVGNQQSGADDIVKALDSMAATIDRHGPGEVGAMILEAVAAIKAGRADLERSLDAEYMQLIDELNKPRGAT